MSERRQQREIVVVGGGLVGALLATLLRNRGHDVALFERRPDLRSADISAGRSINLIATARGLRGVALAGLRDVVVERSAPVWGRTMHDEAGNLTYQPYGRDDTEVNYSVNRGELNQVLLDKAGEVGVDLHFEHTLESMDLNAGELTFTHDGGSTVVEAKRILGTDGANSVVRNQMAKAGFIEQSFTDLGHGYKELEIPPAADGSFRIDERALHIWPRGRYMMMALPNHDGSFTVTLYMAHDGPDGFAALDTEAKVMELFERSFPDSIELIPDLAKNFFANPTGRLGTVRCAPWHHGDRALVIGDAAHAIVPFFGQGMNCGFEDCRVLLELIEKNGDDWATTFAECTDARKKNGDAIADMSLENFREMCADVADEDFLLRKAVEHRLANELEDEYRSRYSIVVYSHIPYYQAKEIGIIQRRILDQLCAGVSSAEEIDLGAARTLIDRELKPYLAEHQVSLDYKYQ